MGDNDAVIGLTVSHYRIIEKLGGGGMGVVYKAEDLSLGRHIALKFLPDDPAPHRHALERFRQEARAASILNHPNICTIYEIGQQGGRPFLAMEFIDGQTLKDRIARGPLPVEELLKVSIQVASALGAAHAKGIIHRDIKPSNVMITHHGQVKLLDFGLAKLVESAERPGDAETRTQWTQAGAIVGTVSYMSPEQVEGKPVDARSDIFSFGVVLFEMLTGQRAFERDGLYLNRADIVRDEPPLREVAFAVPPELERIITRCMRKTLSERFQSITDVQQALEDLSTKVLNPETVASIAVLPFTNPSADKANEYFGDGLAEELINALTRVPGLKVTARTSAFSFRNKEQDIRRIGHALNARTILQGSVRRADNRIRITAQLVNAGDGYHLWSERYDREMTDVFSIQEEIAQAIVEKLKGQLGVSERQPLIHQHPASFRAWHYYWEGRNHQFSFTPDGLSRGKECFERAISRGPALCPAIRCLGRTLQRFGKPRSRSAHRRLAQS
jgi:serine/threonine protein kinase